MKKITIEAEVIKDTDFRSSIALGDKVVIICNQRPVPFTITKVEVEVGDVTASATYAKPAKKRISRKKIVKEIDRITLAWERIPNYVTSDILRDLEKLRDHIASDSE